MHYRGCPSLPGGRAEPFEQPTMDGERLQDGARHATAWGAARLSTGPFRLDGYLPRPPRKTAPLRPALKLSSACFASAAGFTCARARAHWHAHARARLCVCAANRDLSRAVGMQVRLAMDGPGHLRFGVEDALRVGLGPLLRGLDFE